MTIPSGSTLAVLVSGALLGACKHTPPPQAELVTAAALCSDPKYDSHMDEKTAEEVMVRVTVEGYLDIPRGQVTLCSSESCSATLLPAPGAKDGLTINLGIGDDQAQMAALPDHYSEHDLVVHAVGGRTVGVGAHVRVTGPEMGSVSKHSCQLYHVDRVDAL